MTVASITVLGLQCVYSLPRGGRCYRTELDYFSIQFSCVAHCLSINRRKLLQTFRCCENVIFWMLIDNMFARDMYQVYEIKWWKLPVIARCCDTVFACCKSSQVVAAPFTARHARQLNCTDQFRPVHLSSLWWWNRRSTCRNVQLITELNGDNDFCCTSSPGILTLDDATENRPVQSSSVAPPSVRRP